MTGHSHTITARRSDAGDAARSAAPAATAAAAVYVVAWIVGLVLAPSGPGPTDPASSVHAYYADHGPVVVAQSLLIHGLAGVCLLVLAWIVPLALVSGEQRNRVSGDRTSGASGDPWSRWVRVTGFSAAAVSLVQVGLATRAVLGADVDTAATSHAWLWGINHLDTLKLVLLAAFVARVTGLLRTVEEGSTPGRWLVWVGNVLIPLLVLGGLTFMFPSAAVAPLLNAALTLSLLLLLVWAGLIAFTCRPRRGACQHLHGAPH